MACELVMCCEHRNIVRTWWPGRATKYIHILSQVYLLIANTPSSTSTVTISGSAFDGSHVYFPASFIVAFEMTSFEVRDCVTTETFPALISVPTLLPLKYHTIVFGGSVVLIIQIKRINRNNSLSFKRLGIYFSLIAIR